MEASILIVDDDPWAQRVVSSALRDGGYAIATARDGCVALAKALREPPSLVISDVRMPGMSGWRLVRKLRAHRRLAATPFIFLTDLVSTESRRHGFRLGADDYLAKPCHPRELALRVASVLRRGRTRDPRGPAEARGFSGAIEDISLASLLVLLEMEHKTGMLVLCRRGSRERCRVFLRDGHIVAAFLDGDRSRQHLELLYELVGWSAGVFEFKSLAVEMRDEVRANTTQLLMEAMRRVDEDAREPVEAACASSGEFM
jgi:DNA-binding response OmpR family regulator